MNGSAAISQSDPSGDPRVQQIEEWLTQFDDLIGATLVPASGDASFRRYFRVRNAEISRIVMDAPPGQEDCRPFVRIGSMLAEMGLSVPKVLSADLDSGFLLLSDLGSHQYLDVLSDFPERADELYSDAIDALLEMQQKGARYLRELPRYDEPLLRRELSLFPEWLCDKYLGIEIHDADWQQICDVLVANALEQPQAFVHRDYHSRNLMLLQQDNPGILDFQDAVAGPYTYDLVSLLKDCYIRWPSEARDRWVDRYIDSNQARLVTDRDTFVRHFDLMGIQRHLKAAGIFARLELRDGKPDYVRDIPRTLGYVAEAASSVEPLACLCTLLSERVMPAIEGKLS